jgi:hypothetical protein
VRYRDASLASESSPLRSQRLLCTTGILRYIGIVSPTVFREKGYRFFFFSREEPRIHVHVYCSDGEAKFGLEPQIELAKNFRLSRFQIKEIEQLIEAHYDELRRAWKEHFTG